MKPSLPEALTAADLLETARRVSSEGDEASGFLFEGGALENFQERRLEFTGCSFVRCRFEEISVRWLSFTDCIFDGCDFSNAGLRNAAFRRVEIHASRAVGTDISDAWLAHTLVTGCRMNYVGFSKSKLESVLFEDCELKESAFSGCQLKKAEFDRCDLSAAEFLATPLKGVDFRSCQIDGIKLAGGELYGAIVSPEQAVALSKLLGIVVK